jgi:hypothetical protein
MTRFADIVTKSDHQEFGFGGKLENDMWGIREDCNIVRMPSSLNDTFQMKNVVNSLGASVFRNKTLVVGTVTIENLDSYAGLFQDCKIKVSDEKLDFGNKDTSIENMFSGVVFDGLSYGVAIRNGSLCVKNAFNSIKGIRGLGFNGSVLQGLEGLAVNSSIEVMSFFQCQFLDIEPNALDLRLSAIDVFPLGLKWLTLQGCDPRFVEYIVGLVNKDKDVFTDLKIDIKD